VFLQFSSAFLFCCFASPPTRTCTCPRRGCPICPPAAVTKPLQSAGWEPRLGRMRRERRKANSPVMTGSVTTGSAKNKLAKNKSAKNKSATTGSVMCHQRCLNQ
jgi:hypothetical protein